MLGFEILQRLIIVFPIVVISITFHEYSHAFAAYKLGDPTPKNAGRLSLNPLAHVDGPLFFLYFIMFLGFLPSWVYYAVLIVAIVFLSKFGAAKPVGVNPRYFKNPKVGMGITALAGPLSNIISAFVYLFLLMLFYLILDASGAQIVYGTFAFGIVSSIQMFFQTAVSINITLAVFNLIPIPPLDGYRILCMFLPYDIVYKLSRYERYSLIILYLLMAFGILQIPIELISRLIYGAMNSIISLLPFLH